MYDQIKAKVVEAVPEVMELKFGVPFLYTEDGILKQYIFLEESSNGSWYAWDIEQQDVFHHDFVDVLVSIIGREITLSDVLRAIQKELVPQKNSDEWFLVGSMQEHDFFSLWNLSQPLSGQSPETLAFLVDILK